MRERRLVFGEVAEMYDRHRPSYPPALLHDLIAVAALDGSEPALEVGAGTGKASMMLATRGIPVVAVEPDANMAAVARRNLSGFAHVTVEECDFEAWTPRGRRFPLLFSAQAWHWVKPDVGYAKARDVLAPGGVLAPFWNRVALQTSDIRESLLDVYARVAPEVSPDGTMHPANVVTDTAEDWEGRIAAIDGLGHAEVRDYEWVQDYSASEYVGLLATGSEVRLLEDGHRDAFLAAVTVAIRAHGEPLTVPMRTRLYLARRAT